MRNEPDITDRFKEKLNEINKELETLMKIFSDSELDDILTEDIKRFFESLRELMSDDESVVKDFEFGFNDKRLDDNKRACIVAVSGLLNNVLTKVKDVKNMLRDEEKRLAALYQTLRPLEDYLFFEKNYCFYCYARLIMVVYSIQSFSYFFVDDQSKRSGYSDILITISAPVELYSFISSLLQFISCHIMTSEKEPYIKAFKNKANLTKQTMIYLAFTSLLHAISGVHLFIKNLFSAHSVIEIFMEVGESHGILPSMIGMAVIFDKYKCISPLNPQESLDARFSPRNIFSKLTLFGCSSYRQFDEDGVNSELGDDVKPNKIRWNLHENYFQSPKATECPTL